MARSDQLEIEIERGEQRNESLVEEIAALRSLLRDLEWSLTDPWHQFLFCPRCKRKRAHGHAADCRLAELLVVK